MTYNDCQKIVDNTESLFSGTPYSIDYYLDGEPYFLKDGKIIDMDKLPEELITKFYETIDGLEIEF